MSGLIIFILLFSIYANILFYGNSYGLNGILYCIPLLVFSIVVLRKHKKINNKWGLLFLIPIILLSMSFMFYNTIFTKLNIIVIPILFWLMYIYLIKPTFKLNDLILDVLRMIFNRFNPTFINNFFNVVSFRIKQRIKLKNESKKKLISLLVVIPIVLVILVLLITADVQFKKIFNGIIKCLNNFNLYKSSIRLILIFFHFMFMGSFINYLLYKYDKEKSIKNSSFEIDSYTIKLLLILLNVIYVVFDIIQIRSLFLHHVGNGITYSEYARTGFFQLMFVSIINIIILLFSKKSKECSLVKHLSSLLVLLTFVIICSSFYRMYMYDMAYGYTILRLLVYVTLITETILLIPTFIYIYNSKVRIFKYYMIICLTVYVLINVYSIDKIIARNNINRYDNKQKVDIKYLVNLSYDDIPELYDFYSKVDDKSIKKEIKDLVCNKYYINDGYSVNRIVFKKDNNIFEYNYNRNKAYKVLEKFRCK